MKSRSLLLALVLTATVAPWVGAADVIERIVATVNGHIVLQSDWDEAMRYEALAAGKPLSDITTADRKAALDRLIDQELLREQVHVNDFHHAADSEIEKRLEDIRSQFVNNGHADWRSVLAEYHLAENEVKNHITLELDLLRVVDVRLRPTVQIDSKSIESYYNQELLPQLRSSGGREVPLAEVTPKIKEVLTQQKMNELLTAWLQSLRAGSQIRTEDFAGPSQAQ